jgi:hypothetical protein
MTSLYRQMLKELAHRAFTDLERDERKAATDSRKRKGVSETTRTAEPLAILDGPSWPRRAS